MNGTFIALGANKGNPARTFARALAAIDARAGNVTATSSLWHSPAWPAGSGPAYTNAIIQIASRQTPAALLSTLHAIEAEAGRVRTVRNAPRTLDLDIVSHGADLLQTPTLTLPHPRMQDRAFVLLPLSQIAPDYRHPLTGQGVWDMLARLPTVDVLATRALATPLALPRANA